MPSGEIPPQAGSSEAFWAVLIWAKKAMNRGHWKQTTAQNKTKTPEKTLEMLCNFKFAEQRLDNWRES